MSGVGGIFVSLLGVVSMVSLMVAIMLLVHLVQQAFDKAGVVWGMISLVYPPGTYLYCRKNWDVMRDKFIIITGLLIISIILWGIVKIF